MAVAKLTARTAQMFSEYERFEWFLGQLEGSAERYTIEALEVFLETPPTRPAQQHRVLALLALHEDTRSEDVLRGYSPRGGDASLELFRRFALTHRGAPW